MGAGWTRWWRDGVFEEGRFRFGRWTELTVTRYALDPAADPVEDRRPINPGLEIVKAHMDAAVEEMRKRWLRPNGAEELYFDGGHGFARVKPCTWLDMLDEGVKLETQKILLMAPRRGFIENIKG